MYFFCMYIKQNLASLAFTFRRNILSTPLKMLVWNGNFETHSTGYDLT